MRGPVLMMLKSQKNLVSIRVSILLRKADGCTLVESIESEFSAIGRPKRVKNPGKKLYPPLVQSFEEKYFLQMFEFYPSRTLVKSILVPYDITIQEISDKLKKFFERNLETFWKH